MGYLRVRRALEADLGGAAEVDLLARLGLDLLDLARLAIPEGGTWFEFHALRSLRSGSFDATPLHLADEAAKVAVLAALDVALAAAAGYSTADAAAAAGAFVHRAPATVLGL